jgi:hypothetical protein
MINRNNIRERIHSKEFDCIIYGSIRRSTDFIKDVIECYPKNRIIICDGEDDNIVNPFFREYGIYFKRELLQYDALPISFAIPKEKICINSIEKKIDIATIIPGNKSTYIYNDENEYYKGY